jgi:hypothetical protein
MRQHTPDGITPLPRRRFLPGTLAGVAGLTAWRQGWPQLMAAPAQKNGPSGRMIWAVHVATIFSR